MISVACALAPAARPLTGRLRPGTTITKAIDDYVSDAVRAIQDFSDLAAPIVKSGVDAASPYVKSGVDAAAPVVREGLSKTAVGRRQRWMLLHSRETTLATRALLRDRSG